MQRLVLGPADIPVKKGRGQIGMPEVFTFGEVHHQPADDPELNRTLLQVVVDDMPSALTLLGDEVFVITGHADSLDEIGGAEPDQRACCVRKVEYRLLLDGFRKGPKRGHLSHHSAGFNAVEMPVDANGAEHIC